MEKETKNWQYVITTGPDVDVEDVYAKLLELLGVGNYEADDNFVKSNYAIAPVPIEIALSTEERTKLQATCPDVRFIFVGVTEENAKTLVKEYGFTLVKVLPKKKEVPIKKDSAPNLQNYIKININGKEFESEDPEKVKQIAEMFENLVKPEFSETYSKVLDIFKLLYS